MEFSEYERVDLPNILATAVRLAGEGAVARVTWYGPGKEQYVTCENDDEINVRQWFWDHCGDDFFSPQVSGMTSPFAEPESDEDWRTDGQRFYAIDQVRHDFTYDELFAIAAGHTEQFQPNFAFEPDSRLLGRRFTPEDHVAETKRLSAEWLAAWFEAKQAKVDEEEEEVYILIPLTVWLENARTEYELTPALARLLGRVAKGEEVADILEDVLTDEDIRTWHEDAEATDHVESLFNLFGPFDIWGSRTGNEPLTVVWPSAMEVNTD